MYTIFYINQVGDTARFDITVTRIFRITNAKSYRKRHERVRDHAYSYRQYYKLCARQFNLE